MDAEGCAAILARLRACPAVLRPAVDTFGPPCVMITCRTVAEAEAVAALITHAPADLRYLLEMLGVVVVPRQESL